MNCSTPGLPVHHQLPEFTQIHIHWVSDAIQPSHPLSSPFPPAPNPSQHQSLFQWVNSLHEVAKVLEFSFSIIPSKEHPRLISFRMDWLDLLAVQGLSGVLSLRTSVRTCRLLAWRPRDRAQHSHHGGKMKELQLVYKLCSNLANPWIMHSTVSKHPS